MAEFRIIKYEDKYFDAWNSFVKKSNNGTIFHRQDFLNYHGDKFKENEHHLIILKGETIFGLIPMAFFKKEGKIIAKSPYAASYGGFIFNDIVNYSNSRLIISLFINYLSLFNINEVYITPSINSYQEKHCDTFNFNLLESGFKIINSDITNVVNLSKGDIYKDILTSRARNMISKALKFNLNIIERSDINVFWDLLIKTYNKFNKAPTHSLQELAYLVNNFEKEIYFNVVLYENRPISGILIFNLNHNCNLVFYLVTDELYLYTQSLSLLIYHTMLKSKEKGVEFFDFGTSSINLVSNPNLFQFKESFGSIGSFKQTYKLIL
jgi:hypothetical protein